MIFEFRQTGKELFAATFCIVRSDGTMLGEARLDGSAVRTDGDWTLNICEHKIEMIRVTVKEAEKKRGSHGKDKIFKPFKIVMDGCDRGVVFQGIHKVSLLHEYNVHQLIYDGLTRYCMYPIGFGEKGAKNPIYQAFSAGEKQIGQVEKDCLVLDDLHVYQAYIPDDHDVITAVIFCALMYVLGAYKPGVKITEGRKKTVSITTNQEILKKYNPDFWPHG